MNPVTSDKTDRLCVFGIETDSVISSVLVFRVGSTVREGLSEAEGPDGESDSEGCVLDNVAESEKLCVAEPADGERVLLPSMVKEAEIGSDSVCGTEIVAISDVDGEALIPESVKDCVLGVRIAETDCETEPDKSAERVLK